MRKVIAAELITLDWLVSEPINEMTWLLESINEELGWEIREQQPPVDTILLGRKTYEFLAGYWPTATPDTEDALVIDFMNNTPKIVFSRTLERVEWSNSRLVSDDIAAEVEQLKRLPGRDIAIVGSCSIVRQFIRLGLIDEYRLSVHPVILGTGARLVAEVTDRRDLDLTRAEAFKNGVVSLCYQPART